MEVIPLLGLFLGPVPPLLTGNITYDIAPVFTADADIRPALYFDWIYEEGSTDTSDMSDTDSEPPRVL